MPWTSLYILGGVIMAGIAVGLHLGWIDGVAASLVVYALMPYKPKKGSP